MIASFHLLTFRRRRLLPHGRTPGCIEGLRFWKAFFTAADPFAAIAPDISRIRVMTPNLREWAFFGVWRSDRDLDRFLADSHVADTWRDECSEAWSVRLEPVYSRGEWPGVRELRGSHPRDSAAPAAVITRLDVPLRVFVTMWRAAAPELAPHLPSVPGLLMGIAMIDRFYVHAMTFSLWRSGDDALAFAYDRTPHQEALDRLRSVDRDIASRFSSARFYPYGSQGTWQGADPLAAWRTRI